MGNKSSEDLPNLARTIRELMDGRLPPIDDLDVLFLYTTVTGAFQVFKRLTD